MTASYSGYPEGSSAVSSGGAGEGSASGVKEQAKEQAQQVAGTAGQEARHVAGVAQGEAQRVASEASSQVRGLVGEATAQVEEQSRTQLGRLTEALRSWGADLERMASQGEGPASGVTREAAERVQAVASHLEGREPRDLVEDVRGFARRRPGVFLGSALVAGVVVGRLTRGAKAAHDDSTSGPTGPTPAYGAPRSYPATGGDSQSYLRSGTVPSPDGFDYDSAGTDPTYTTGPAGGRA